MDTPTDADLLAALERTARPATPDEIRAHFGPDVDLCEAMKALTVID